MDDEGGTAEGEEELREDGEGGVGGGGGAEGGGYGAAGGAGEGEDLPWGVGGSVRRSCDADGWMCKDSP